jgi:hypothetical protein
MRGAMRLLLFAHLALPLLSHEAQAACGDRGGPGYRAPNGRCVSWAEIGRVCGSPPSKNCVAELPTPDAEKAAREGADIESMRLGNKPKPSPNPN